MIVRRRRSHNKTAARRENNMKRTIAAATVAAAAALTSAPAEARWYVSHLGADTCVPLDRIDTDKPERRLYYSSGPLQTPEDFVRWFASVGASLKRQPSPTPAIRIYLYKGMELPLIDGEELCQKLMAMMVP
jgi:hypothetical protein